MFCQIVRRLVPCILVGALASHVFAETDKRRLGKLSYALDQLASAAERGETLPRLSTRYLDTAKGEVTLVVVLAPGADPNDLTPIIRANGGAVQARSGELVKVTLPAITLRSVSDHPIVEKMRLPFAARAREIVTEGVDVVHARELIARTGADGTGVTVAVLDIGFGGLEAQRGSEIPESTTLTTFLQENLASLGDVHGTACAEVIHDVAPGASLLLGSFAGDEVTWGAELDRLADSGARIISHSVGFDNIAVPDGNNFFARKVDELAARGVLFVTAAGNEGHNYFQGVWQDANANGLLDFAAGAEVMALSFPGAGQVVLRWDDPFGASSHDFDLFLVRPGFFDGGDASQLNFSADNPNVLAMSANLQAGAGDPVERVEQPATEEPVLVVVRHDGTTPANPSQQLFLFSSNGIPQGLQTASSSLTLPGDARGALSVGAVQFSTLEVESFSSRGPTADGRVKPDVAGPDGVSTASYGERSFFGTSAATPHVSGAAALILAANPSFDLQALRDALERATDPRGQSGKTNELGFGIVDLSRLP